MRKLSVFLVSVLFLFSGLHPVTKKKRDEAIATAKTSMTTAEGFKKSGKKYLKKKKDRFKYAKDHGWKVTNRVQYNKAKKARDIVQGHMDDFNTIVGRFAGYRTQLNLDPGYATVAAAQSSKTDYTSQRASKKPKKYNKKSKSKKAKNRAQRAEYYALTALIKQADYAVPVIQKRIAADALGAAKEGAASLKTSAQAKYDSLVTVFDQIAPLADAAPGKKPTGTPKKDITDIAKSYMTTEEQTALETELTTELGKIDTALGNITTAKGSSETANTNAKAALAVVIEKATLASAATTAASANAIVAELQAQETIITTASTTVDTALADVKTEDGNIDKVVGYFDEKKVEVEAAKKKADEEKAAQEKADKEKYIKDIALQVTGIYNTAKATNEKVVAVRKAIKTGLVDAYPAFEGFKTALGKADKKVTAAKTALGKIKTANTNVSKATTEDAADDALELAQPTPESGKVDPTEQINTALTTITKIQTDANALIPAAKTQVKELADAKDRSARMSTMNAQTKMLFVAGDLYSQGDGNKLYIWRDNVWSPLGEMAFTVGTVISKSEAKIYAHGADKKIYKYENGTWSALGGNTFVVGTKILTWMGGLVWAQGEDGKIYEWSGTAWTVIGGRSFKVGTVIKRYGGKYYAHGTDGKIYRYENEVWNSVGEKTFADGTRIIIGFRSVIWAQGSDGKIYKWVKPSDDEPYRWRSVGSKEFKSGTVILEIGGRLWAHGSDGKIYSWARTLFDSTYKWRKYGDTIFQTGTRIKATFLGTAWAQGEDGKMYAKGLIGNSWKAMGDSVFRKGTPIIKGETIIYAQGTNGKIYQNVKGTWTYLE
jgi:hypothetical protein